MASPGQRLPQWPLQTPERVVADRRGQETLRQGQNRGPTVLGVREFEHPDSPGHQWSRTSARAETLERRRRSRGEKCGGGGPASGQRSRSGVQLRQLAGGTPHTSELAPGPRPPPPHSGRGAHLCKTSSWCRRGRRSQQSVAGRPRGSGSQVANPGPGVGGVGF